MWLEEKRLDNAVRRRVLLVTQLALRVCSEEALCGAVERLGVEQLDVAARAPSFAWQTIGHLFAHGTTIPREEAAQYLAQLLVATQPSGYEARLQWVTLSRAQMAALGVAHEHVEEDLARVRESVTRGMDLLSAVFPAGAERVRASLRFVMGLKGRTDETRGFSSWRLPGFAAIGTNVITLLVAEQLVHEATHVALESLLENEDTIRAWLDAQPSVPSPFTSSVRPARLVVHGWLSYGMVRELWERSVDCDWVRCGFGTREELEGVARKRQDLVAARIAEARAVLEESVDDVARLRDLGARLCTSLLEVAAAAISRGAMPSLGRQERAEVMLATEGAKVSRITVDPRTGFRMARALRPRGHCCFSRATFRLMHDPQIGGFSNVAMDASAEDPEASVYAYVATDLASAKAAAQADEHGEAGEIFGIPSCCRAWFESNWPRAVAQHAGDLVSLLLGGTPEGIVDVPADAPPPALYFDSGLHFHFPCSLSCQPTSEVVRSRIAFLANSDPELLAELTSRVARPYLWVRGRGYLRLDGEEPDTWAVRGDQSVSRELGIHRVGASDLMTGRASELCSRLFPNGWRILRPA